METIMETGIETTTEIGMIEKLNVTSAVVKDISHVAVDRRKDLTMRKMTGIAIRIMKGIGIAQTDKATTGMEGKAMAKPTVL